MNDRIELTERQKQFLFKIFKLMVSYGEAIRVCDCVLMYTQAGVFNDNDIEKLEEIFQPAFNNFRG